MSSDTRDRALYSIGQFAKLTGFPIKTLRYYDEEDVLKPAFVDPETGYRSYTETQRQQMHLLAEVHILDVPLEMLRAFMRDPTLEHQGVLYEWKIAQLKREIEHRQHGLQSLQRKRDHPWRGQQYEVVVDQPSRPWVSLYYVTHMSGFEADREQAFDTVRTYLTRHGVLPASPPTTLSLPTKTHRDVLKGVEVYAGCEVTEPVPAEGDMLVGTTPAGQWLRGDAHGTVRAYLARDGHAARPDAAGWTTRAAGRGGIPAAGGVPRRTVGHARRRAVGYGRAVTGSPG